MISNQIEIFRKRLKSDLKPSRYEHSLSVSFICTALAMRYGVDLHQAEIAGLLHDCAKYRSDAELVTLCDIHHVDLTEDEQMAPSIIHAKFGSWMAEHIYGINDPEILEAIHWHTTGKARMSTLEMILYIADYIEPRRETAPNLSNIRQLAFISLEKTMYEITKESLQYLEQMGLHIDLMTKEAYDYYLNNRNV